VHNETKRDLYSFRTSQIIVQNLPFPTTNKHNVHVIRRYHKHLHDGTKADAVSGWTHDSCNTTSLLNNVLTVKTSRSPFRSLSNIVNNSRLLDRFIFPRNILSTEMIK
jgi:hypothetical protein